MNEKIISRMSEIVAEIMTSFQSDFENYDRPYIESANNFMFPMIWIVGRSHTYLLKLGEYDKNFNENEIARYAYVQGGNPFLSYLDALGGDHLFLIEPDGVREMTEKQAREVCRDIVTPVAEKWIKENGPLPTKVQVPVKFFNITLSKVKELIHECEAHNDKSLIEIFRRFHNYRRVAKDQYIQISYNPGYNEFTFCEYTNGNEGLVGGIIFHGWPETGYMVNGSYQMEPTYGWSSHT